MKQPTFYRCLGGVHLLVRVDQRFHRQESLGTCIGRCRGRLAGREASMSVSLSLWLLSKCTLIRELAPTGYFESGIVYYWWVLV